MRLRRRAAALVAGAALLFGIGTSVQSGWLLVLSACLLGAAIAGAVLPLRMTRGVEVERRAPAECFQGDRARVDLVVRNRSRGLRLGVLVEDPHLETVRAYRTALMPGEAVLVETERTAARRGVQRSAEAWVRSAAPFGVAERRRRVAAEGSTTVFPALVRLPALPFLGSSPTAERALHSAPRRGGGPDYLGIREYRPGDSMRHVHWPSTARLGELMVREFEREETRRLAVVVDASADLGETFTPLDRCCSVAASVAFAASSRGQGVRLVAAEAGEPVELVRAGPAAELTWLAELRPGAGLALPALLGSLGAELQGADTVVLALPTWRSNAAELLADAVDDLATWVPTVVAVLVEVHTFEGGGRRRAGALDAGEVEGLADALDGRGALVVRLGAVTDLAEALGRLPAGVAR